MKQLTLQVTFPLSISYLITYFTKYFYIEKDNNNLAIFLVMDLFYAVLFFSLICLVFTDNSRDSRLLLNDPNLLISQIQALESKIQQLTTAYHDQRRTIQALQSQVQTGNNGTCLTCIKYLCLKLWYFCNDISVYIWICIYMIILTFLSYVTYFFVIFDKQVTYWTQFLTVQSCDLSCHFCVKDYLPYQLFKISLRYKYGS